MKARKAMTDKELETSIEKYRGMLYRLAYSMSGNHSDSEDIVQEAFIKLYTRDKPLCGEDAEKAWLIRVTVNLCKNRVRLCANRRRAELSEDIRSHDGERDEYIDLRSALKKLKPDYRAVIYMFYYEGFGTEEIAEYLGISVTAVTTRLQRGREKLKKFLED